jgi:hypothetical protein
MCCSGHGAATAATICMHTGPVQDPCLGSARVLWVGVAVLGAETAQQGCQKVPARSLMLLRS